jgi:alanine dehydrogenase
MRIAIPTEIKEGERRVALTPGCVRELVRDGHAVAVQAGAGAGSGFSDEDFASQGAQVVQTAADAFEFGELILKVKEPQRSELALLAPRHVLFTYLHLAADPELAVRLVETGATCAVYETLVDESGRLPLLAPMSEIAGRIAALLGMELLLAPSGGAGLLMGGVAGVQPGRAVVLGGGVVGEHAAAVLLGLGAQVTVLDRSLSCLRHLDARFQGRAVTAFSTDHAIEQAVRGANLVIGAVLLTAARAPRLLRREHLRLFAPGAVLVDVAIDQGGCAETSKPTTHAAPSYDLDGVRHAAVTNLPAAAPVTATRALTNATLPYVRRIAQLGSQQSLVSDPVLETALNVADGGIARPTVARAVQEAAPA